jgi:hypothetical protein
MLALGSVPAAAKAALPSSTITSWASQGSDPQGHPIGVTNGSYLIAYANPPTPTTLTVTGSATGIDRVDIVCYYGAGPSFGDKVLVSNVDATSGTFSASGQLSSIAGHACRLRAIPTGGESSSDTGSFAGPQVAVSEVELPAAASAGKPYDIYVDGTTFSGSAAWNSAGTCGPYAVPLDPSFGAGNYAIDCMGSLLGSNLAAGATRSEVQVDGQDAYDAASAQAVFGGTEDSADLPALSAAVNWDPATGLVSSQSGEDWVICSAPVVYPPTADSCPTFASAGVHLERDVGMSDGGLVVTMTDTWSSTDGRSHTLDLLYDDYVGLKALGTTRGYEFPGQSSFSPYTAGTTLPGPGAAPGSILVRTNLAAADGDQSEAVGAITFSSAPAGFAFAGNDELEEHQVLQVPAGGSTRLTYIYSTGYSVADVEALALAAQDRIQSPAIAITSPANGATVSAPTVTLSGLAGAGSGIVSLQVGGQPVAVAPGGAWSTVVRLNRGANTITATAIDGAGATAQAQVTILYEPPSPPPPAKPRLFCRVPRTKGLKLPAAEEAIRQAHCRVGKIKKIHSRKVRKGRVVETVPTAGRKLPSAWNIELLVSSGP